MFWRVIDFLAQIPSATPLTLIGNPYLHPLVDSSEYAWNVAGAFGVSMLFYMIGTAIFLLPKHLGVVKRGMFKHLFYWTGGTLILEASARLVYTLLLLNVDANYGWLYHTLPVVRVAAMLSAFITWGCYCSMYAQIKKFDKVLK